MPDEPNTPENDVNQENTAPPMPPEVSASEEDDKLKANIKEVNKLEAELKKLYDEAKAENATIASWMGIEMQIESLKKTVQKSPNINLQENGIYKSLQYRKKELDEDLKQKQSNLVSADALGRRGGKNGDSGSVVLEDVKVDPNLKLPEYSAVVLVHPNDRSSVADLKTNFPEEKTPIFGKQVLNKTKKQWEDTQDEFTVTLNNITKEFDEFQESCANVKDAELSRTRAIYSSFSKDCFGREKTHDQLIDSIISRCQTANNRLQYNKILLINSCFNETCNYEKDNDAQNFIAKANDALQKFKDNVEEFKKYHKLLADVYKNADFALRSVCDAELWFKQNQKDMPLHIVDDIEKIDNTDWTGFFTMNAEVASRSVEQASKNISDLNSALRKFKQRMESDYHKKKEQERKKTGAKKKGTRRAKVVNGKRKYVVRSSELGKIVVPMPFIIALAKMLLRTFGVEIKDKFVSTNKITAVRRNRNISQDDKKKLEENYKTTNARLQALQRGEKVEEIYQKFYYIRRGIRPLERWMHDVRTSKTLNEVLKPPLSPTITDAMAADRVADIVIGRANKFLDEHLIVEG